MIINIILSFLIITNPKPNINPVCNNSQLYHFYDANGAIKYSIAINNPSTHCFPKQSWFNLKK
ncbi:MAG: hypothetical protein LC122_14275 [Chitinophagales bacterium]|nr:hypothetical protein [Chitinophagales bacterium]